ncbi:hypothetical protein DV706_18820 (plasmid) [Natronorubrum bangense]|uniref:Uncharacterized protein n=2 Tax=Natronorubrum bangense TaxID=61858 RepID=L9WAS8_9EURY|nr:hypothetical protein C494_14568 [Natronorubrum bangense JCM 10635]QCC56551.1 hypothetical protein DV706_18820 [Natronorubrum bangense]
MDCIGVVGLTPVLKDGILSSKKIGKRQDFSRVEDVNFDFPYSFWPNGRIWGRGQLPRSEDGACVASLKDKVGYRRMEKRMMDIY